MSNLRLNSDSSVDAEAAKVSHTFPAKIFAHATAVVTSGDGQERAFAARVLCTIAAHKHSWPVSRRSGHAVAAVDDALLSLAVGMQDMDPQVCCVQLQQQQMSCAVFGMPSAGFPWYCHGTAMLLSGFADMKGNLLESVAAASGMCMSTHIPSHVREGNTNKTLENHAWTRIDIVNLVNMQVRRDIVLLLPRLRTASEKYINIVLDKRKTLLLQRKDPSATVSKLPESPSIILESAAGAPPFLSCSS